MKMKNTVKFQWTPKEQELIDQGYRMIREYNPWGYAPCFSKFDKEKEEHSMLFVVNEKTFTVRECYDDLVANWFPASQKERDWKAYQMKRYFLIQD
jgi:hypothetical protein